MLDGSRILLKSFFLLMLILLLFLFSWLESNVENLADWSSWFFGFGVVSLVVIVLTSVYQFTRKEDDIEFFKVTIAEKGGVLDKIKNADVKKYVKFFVYLFLIIGVSLFAYVRAKKGFEVIDAPEYTTISIGPFTVNGAILSGCAGLIENYGMFGVIPNLFGFTVFFFLTYWIINGKIDVSNLPKASDHKAKIPLVIGTIMFFVIGTLGWVIYHWGRYGFTDMEGSLSVAIFAFVNLFWVWVLQDIVVPSCYHFFNNIGLRLKNVEINYWKILINPVTLIILGILIILLYIRWKLRKNGKRR